MGEGIRNLSMDDRFTHLQHGNRRGPAERTESSPDELAVEYMEGYIPKREFTAYRGGEDAGVYDETYVLICPN